MRNWLVFLCLLLVSSLTFSAGTSNNILVINTGSTSITTGAFVQLSASTPIPSTNLVIANGTSSIIKVATGASSSEVSLISVGGSSTLSIKLGKALPAATRISLEAVDATASSGYITVSLLP